MTSASPSRGLDLVVVGGLTVDRFTDGSSAAGGAVLHIARALAARGLRVGIVTTAGPEAEAQAGLAELHDLAVSVEASTSPASITFGHAETAAGRELVLERRGGQVPAATADPSAPSCSRRWPMKSPHRRSRSVAARFVARSCRAGCAAPRRASPSGRGPSPPWTPGWWRRSAHWTWSSAAARTCGPTGPMPWRRCRPCARPSVIARRWW